MGVTYTDVTIRNPADRTRSWQGRFLIDTGATDSLVPRQHLEEIGLVPESQRTYVLADGSEITMEIAVVRIEMMGEVAGGTVLFGDTSAEPLLGVTALESLGIEVDPLHQRLKKLPAVRLKELARRLPDRTDPGPGGDARDRMPVAPQGDPDFTGVEAALHRAAAHARRQAAAAGGEVVVFRDGEVVRKQPGPESISASGSTTRQAVDTFEKRPVTGAGLDDLEDFLLKEHFRSRFPDRRSPDDRVSFLAARKLVVITDAGVVPTPLGLLLFAMQPEEHVPGAYVEIVSYRHNDPDGDAAVRDRIAGPLPEQIKRALTYLLVSSLTPTASRKGACGRHDYPSYADRALREAIVNAVVHREYGIPGSPIVIRLFPDRIEFRNPGALCGGLTVEDLYAGRRPVRRNPLLAGFLHGYRDDVAGGALMAARGEGFLNLVRASERLSGRRPELEQIGEATKLTIFAAQYAAP